MAVLNQSGLDLIKSFEKCVLYVYDDGYGFATAGWGHRVGEIEVGTPVTQVQADQWLAQDLYTAGQAVAQLVRVPLTDNQFSALVSFVYNAGVGGLAHSTLLRLLNAGKYTEAADQFGLWVYSAGQLSVGLERRRAAERALFLA